MAVLAEVGGVGQVAQYCPAVQVIVCVEDNDPDVCELLTSYAACCWPEEPGIASMYGVSSGPSWWEVYLSSMKCLLEKYCWGGWNHSRLVSRVKFSSSCCLYLDQGNKGKVSAM